MKSEIWAIGGGKGGTGKSFVTSSIGMNLAQQGKRVTLIDADLGGANLHTFLRMKKPKHSLTDFFESKTPLSDIIKNTDVPNLRFITGDVRSLDTTGVKYAQKLKLYRHIRNISSDYVLIDLGAGSNHDTIDSFLVADRMIAVILPEETSLDNLYLFIKKVLFRKVNRLLGDYGLRDIARKAWEERNRKEIRNIKELILYVKNISPEIRTLVEKSLADFTLYIIVNQVKNEQHIETGFATKSILQQYFELDAKYLGYIRYNEFFWKFVKDTNSFKQFSPSVSTALEIGSIVQNLMENKQLNLSQVHNGI